MIISNVAIDFNDEKFNNLGVQLGDLDHHSHLKVCGTMVADLSKVYSPMAIICLRYYWSMGPVKYRYLHYKKLWDKYAGR